MYGRSSIALTTSDVSLLTRSEVIHDGMGTDTVKNWRKQNGCRPFIYAMCDGKALPDDARERFSDLGTIGPIFSRSRGGKDLARERAGAMSAGKGAALHCANRSRNNLTAQLISVGYEEA